MSCSIELKGVFYKNSRLNLENIHLNVGHKEKIAIVGDNGCGKTSLLKIIAGILIPSSGDVSLFHKPVKEKKMLDLGFLPQDIDEHFLFPTVLEDVCFSLLCSGVDIKTAEFKALDLLEQFGVLDLKNENPLSLSGGEKKIIALAGILAPSPKILLLDEPTNALDKNSSQKLVQILKSIDKSMVIVSHQDDFLSTITSKFYKLDKNLKALN